MLDFISNHKLFSVILTTTTALLMLFFISRERSAVSESEYPQPDSIASDEACADSLSYEKLLVAALQATNENGIDREELKRFELDGITGRGGSRKIIVARKGRCHLVINSGASYISVYTGTLKRLP